LRPSSQNSYSSLFFSSPSMPLNIPSYFPKCTRSRISNVATPRSPVQSPALRRPLALFPRPPLLALLHYMTQHFLSVYERPATFLVFRCRDRNKRLLMPPIRVPPDQSFPPPLSPVLNSFSRNCPYPPHIFATLFAESHPAFVFTSLP